LSVLSCTLRGMSKQKRKQTARRRKRELAARAARGGTTIAPSVRMLVDSVERFAPYLALSDAPDAVVALALSIHRDLGCGSCRDREKCS
jgi:hypothetical protein